MFRRVPSPVRLLLVAVVILVAALIASGLRGAQANTFVVPHILEKSGMITNTQNTFDTQFFVTYAPGLAGIPAGMGATISLYLYADDGSPMKSGTNQNVCAPCLVEVGGGATQKRKQSIRVDDLIMAAGGFGSTPDKKGFAVLDVSGDPNNLVMEEQIQYAHTNSLDLSVARFLPPIVPRPSGVRVLVVPHVLETSGRVSSTPFAVDTEILATYTGGLPGMPAGTGATLDFYLFDDSGSSMTGPLGPVCDPCSYTFSPGGPISSQRKQTIALDDLITTRGGGFSTPTKTGFGVLVVGGADPNGLTFQGFVTNTHNNAFDLSVFGFEPQPIAAAATNAVLDPVSGAVHMLRSSPNPSQKGMTFAFDLARAAHVNLEVFDAGGRRVAGVYSGRREAGSHTLRWNRQDDAGNPLPSGIYFGRLQADDGSRVSKLVFLPE